MRLIGHILDSTGRIVGSIFELPGDDDDGLGCLAFILMIILAPFLLFWVARWVWNNEPEIYWGFGILVIGLIILGSSGREDLNKVDKETLIAFGGLASLVAIGLIVYGGYGTFQAIFGTGDECVTTSYYGWDGKFYVHSSCDPTPVVNSEYVPVSPPQNPNLYSTYVPPSPPQTPIVNQVVQIPPTVFVPAAPTPTPQPKTGTLQIELRHADGLAVLNTSANIFHQAFDINGLPILGDEVSATRTSSGSSGLVTFTVDPGTYVVLLDLPGSRFLAQGGSWNFQSWPGVPNLTVTAGATTRIALQLGVIVSTLSTPAKGVAHNSCLRTKYQDGSFSDSGCQNFADGISRIESLPGTYTLSFHWAIDWSSYDSEAGTVTVTAGQTVEKHCQAILANGQYADHQPASCN